ncbi:hypothetical protein ElyMa_004046600 [Elysia marginata]|uniref:Uncharacterized protein n=1 Tax=Elysia marginata TaxID=1093978 RepID=A0AAV4G636_9GAST|nr:hypothetical protein ElyMa_004046600 [Elysia marginata]
MRCRPAQEDEAHSEGNSRWPAIGALQPIVCFEIYATYGFYDVIRYRRRRARYLLTEIEQLLYSGKTAAHLLKFLSFPRLETDRAQFDLALRPKAKYS